MGREITEKRNDTKRVPLGTSKFIDQNICDQQGYQEGDFWLGRTMSGRPFGWYEGKNLLTCAGTQAGKGISTVVPNLLLYPGTAVVIDPKGELADLTAVHRAQKFGHKIVVLDPYNVAKNVPDELKGTYNPLTAINSEDDMQGPAQAQTLASAIVAPQPDAKEPFWSDTAQDFIQAAILYMVRKFAPEERNLMKLRQTVALGDWDMYQEFTEIMREEDPEFNPESLKAYEMLLNEMTEMDDFGGIIRESAGAIQRFGEQTQGNILGNAMTSLNFLKEPQLCNNLINGQDEENTFTLPELRSQEQHITIYLCLPTSKMQQQGKWLKLIVMQIMEYAQSTEFDKNTDLPIMMMLDEFFQLGPIPTIANTLTYASSYGLRLWLIIQDLNQLKKNYPKDWETIFGACGIKQFFGFNDLTTAKYISELLGDAEIDVPSVTYTITRSQTEGETKSNTEGESESETQGKNWSSARGRTVTDTTGFTKTEGYTHTKGHSTGTSDGTNSSYGTNEGTGTNHGINQNSSSGNGASVSYNFDGIKKSNAKSNSTSNNSSQSQQSGTNSGTSTNQSTSVSSGVTRQHSTQESTSNSYNQSTSINQSHAIANSYTDTDGGSHSINRGTNRSQTTALNQAMSSGMNIGTTYSKQARKLYKPEELLGAFTADNLMQLVLIRDRGAHLLQRTPYFADRDIRQIVEESKD